MAALAASLAVMAAAPAAQGAFQWSDGTVQRSYITNCASIIFGSPYQEEGAWTWNGQYLDPADFPNVGQTFYVHVVAGAVGNACSGQYVHFEALGPSGGGLNYAITPGTPVFCYAINWNTNPPSATSEPAWPTGACPQVIQTGGFQGNPWDAATNPSNPQDTDPWPLPQGRGWEIQIPVVATRTMSGGFGACSDCNRFMGYILDGNSSPQLISTQGLFVEASGGGGGSTPGSAGGDEGSGGSLAPIPQRPAPPRPTAVPTATPTAAPAKKCKKGQKLKKGKCVKKKRKKK